MADIFAALAAQFQTGQVPLAAPGPAPAPIPAPPPPPPVMPLAPEPNIAQKLKEARQLGCIAFRGDIDASAAKEWVQQVSDTLQDILLDDELKLIVATRLLKGRAKVWWANLRNQLEVPMTWAEFLREFDKQYFTHFHQKEKKREFMDLKQGNMTVEEYEARFNELL